MNDIYVYGKNAVLEALKNENRCFNKVLISQTNRNDEKIEKIKVLAKESGIVFQFVSKEKINQIVPDVKHQGVVAILSPIKYVEFEDFLKLKKDTYKSVVILDGVEDSHNLGAIIRTAVCAGVDAIILPARHGVLLNSTVEKVSAGAVNNISIIKVNSLVATVQRLKEENFWIVSADHHAKQLHFDVDYTDMNFVLIMGAEHAGVSKSLLKMSDFIVKIPMLANFNSLNVSNATAVVLFEYVRQKFQKSIR